MRSGLPAALDGFLRAVGMVGFEDYWDLYLLAGAGWTVLLASLLLRRAPGTSTSRSQILGWICSLAVLVVAWRARVAAPFWPLHSNDHAYHDMATALGLSGSSGWEMAYGLSWTSFQQVTVPLFGADHDGLGLLSSVLGALAAWFTFLAAWTASRNLPAACLAGAFAALAPISMRVGHSESPFVVAQLLVATALFLATGRRTGMSVAGTAAAILLLATGHPVGPALAFGVALLAWSLSPEPWQDARHGLRHLFVLFGAALWGSVVSFTTASNVVAAQTAGGGFMWMFGRLLHPSVGLWRDPDWSAPAFLVLVPFGMVGAWLGGPDARRWRAAAGSVGVLAIGLAGLVAPVCISDVLRYQSVWVAPIALFLGLAPRSARTLSGNTARLVLVAVLLAGLMTAYQLVRAKPGDRLLDVQGQTYHLLREALRYEHGQVALVPPDTAEGTKACFDIPVGRWSKNGPTVTSLPMDTLEANCHRNSPLPTRAWILFEPGCDVALPQDRLRPCTVAENYAGTKVWSAVTMLLPETLPSATRPEFFGFRSQFPRVQLSTVVCPRR